MLAVDTSLFTIGDAIADGVPGVSAEATEVTDAASDATPFWTADPRRFFVGGLASTAAAFF